MDSPGDGLDRWPPRRVGRTGELAEPVGSPGSDDGLCPVKSLGSADHLLHLPGRADSAYSSFSGGSSVPEYPCPGAKCCLPPERAPYMDSEYVRGIYSPGAANPELGCPHPHQAPDLSIPSGASAPTRGAFPQGLLGAPPVRLNSHRITRHPESSRGRRSSGGDGESSAQAGPCTRDARLADGAVPWGGHRVDAAEQDLRVLRAEALESKSPPPDSTKEAPLAKPRGVKAEEDGEWSRCQGPVRRSNPQVCSRPSSFIFQEYLKRGSVATPPTIPSAYGSLHAHRAPGEMNPRGCHPAHSHPRALSDAQGDRESPCGVNKPISGVAHLRSSGSQPSQPRGSLPCAPCPPCAELHWDGDQEVFEDCCDLNLAENALPAKSASRELNGCLEGNQGYDCEGSDGRDPLLNPSGRMQRPSASRSYSAAGAGLGQGTERCCTATSQEPSLRAKEDPPLLFSPEVEKEHPINGSSPDPSRCLEQGEPPAPELGRQPELPSRLSRRLQSDPGAGQITRQTTPLLYYLSRGKTSGILQHNKLPQCQEDSGNSSKESPASSHSAPVRCLQGQREGRQAPRSKHHPGSSSDEAEDLLSGSPASSTEESFKDDYREKLKVAQKKVLRETSFKRKDLQMSLPVRLRQKPSRRPTIGHLRSFSLTSAADDEARPAPCSPSHLESVGSISREEEIQRPQRGRTGGRRRVAAEQKKLCYSEPEKLDQLAEKESWSQVREEISEQDAVAARRKALESRGRALSSSSISRTELKQIQHTALVAYMERKISQRPGGSQHLPPHRPPLQNRLSHPKWPPGKASDPSGSRRVQSTQGSCHVFSKEKPPDAVPPLALVPPLRVTGGCDASAAAAATPKHKPSPREEEGSCSIKSVSAESLPQAGDAGLGRVRQRSKSTPAASTQDSDRGVGGAEVPSQHGQSCLDSPSSRGPEKDGFEHHEGNDKDTTGCPRSQELTPETSIPAPRRGSEDDAQLEEEGRTKSSKDNALVKRPERQPAAPQEPGTRCHAVSAPRGDAAVATGSVVKDVLVPSSPDDALAARETSPPERTLQSPEDQRYEELAMEIVAKDSSLVPVLTPHPVRSTVLELMEALFPTSVAVLGKARPRRGELQPRGDDRGRRSSREATESPEAGHDTKQRTEGPTSAANQLLNRSREGSDDLDDITPKKLELISCLRSKLQALWEERELVLSEGRECSRRGEELEATVRAVCKPNEFERYLMFIGDLEKVVSLLLCLSSRLARVQNALSRVDGSTDAEEKQSLHERHRLLCRQRDDARDLKENLDRRERVVSGILAKYLTEQQLQDYRRFVQLKTSLLIEQKDLEEQIRLLEEQLENLEQSLPL